MCHTMKPWKRIIKHGFERVENDTKNQFGLMPGKLTTAAIFLLCQLMERDIGSKRMTYIWSSSTWRRRMIRY
jgi:hypothetical protein